MDESLQYLIEAQSYLNKIKPIDVSNIFFEADSECTKKQMKTNEKAKNGFIQSIKKAFQAIIDSIKKIIEKIRTKFRELGMSKEDKLAYEQFKKACAENPNLANKEITVVDIEKLKKNVQPHMDALNKAVAAGDKRAIEKESGILEKLIGDNAVSKTIKASNAWKYMEQCRKSTLEVAAWLETDSKFTRHLIDKANQKELANLSPEEMEAMGAQGAGQRMAVKQKTGLFHKFTDAMGQCKRDIVGLIKLGSKDKITQAQGMAAVADMGLRSPIASGIASKVLKHKARHADSLISMVGYDKASEILKDKKLRTDIADNIRAGGEAIQTASIVRNTVGETIKGVKGLAKDAKKVFRKIKK